MTRLWVIGALVGVIAGVSSGAVYQMDIGGLGLGEAADVSNGVPAAPAGWTKVGGFSIGNRFDNSSQVTLDTGVTAGFFSASGTDSPGLDNSNTAAALLPAVEPQRTLLSYSASMPNYLGTVQFQVRGLAAGQYDVTVYSWSSLATEYNTIVTWTLDWGTGNTTLTTGPALTTAFDNAWTTASVTLPAGATLSVYPSDHFRPDAPSFFLPTPPLSAMAIAPVPEPATLSLMALGSLMTLRRRRAS